MNSQEKFIDQQIRAGLKDYKTPENFLKITVNQALDLYKKNQFSGKPSKLIQETINQAKKLAKKKQR